MSDGGHGLIDDNACSLPSIIPYPPDGSKSLHATTIRIIENNTYIVVVNTNSCIDESGSILISIVPIVSLFNQSFVLDNLELQSKVTYIDTI